MRSKKNTHKLQRFLRIKEWAMALLAIMSVLFIVLEHFERLSETQLHAVEVFEMSVAGVFLAEWLFELYHARDKAAYVRQYGIYLLAAIPIPTATFEILRGIRLLRLVKLLDVFAHLRYETNTKLFDD